MGIRLSIAGTNPRALPWAFLSRPFRAKKPISSKLDCLRSGILRSGILSIVATNPRALPWAFLSRPFRAKKPISTAATNPRALPWAFLSRPFRAKRPISSSGTLLEKGTTQAHQPN